MQIKWPLPIDIQNEVESRAANEEIIISLASDMATPERFAVGWLVVTEQRLLTFLPAEDDSYWQVTEYNTNDLQWAKVDPLVGGGRLWALINTELVTLIYFSSSLSERFAEAARALEKVAIGEDPGTFPPEDVRRCTKCNRLLPEPGGLCPACVRKVVVLMRIASYMKPYWPSGLALALVALVSTGARLIPPKVTRMIIDQVLTERQVKLLVPLVLTLLGVYVLEAVAGFVHSWIVAALSAKVTRDIRAHIYRVLERLTLRFYDKRQIGSIMSRVTSDSDRLQGVLVDGLPYIISNTVLIVGEAVMLFAADWQLALCAFAPAPLLLLGGAGFWRHLQRMFYAWGQK